MSKRSKLLIPLLLSLLPWPAEAQTKQCSGQAAAVPPGYLFRDVVGSNFAANYGWYGEQVVAASRAVAQGNGTPSRFPNSSLQWNIEPGDSPIPGLTTERDEFLFAMNQGGNGGYDVGSYGTYQCLAMSIFLPTGWTDSVPNTSLTTSAVTVAGNATLNFAGTGGNVGTNCPVGSYITDSTAAVIPASTTVLTASSTTIGMSANATGGGVGSGDTILCGYPWFFIEQLHAINEDAPGIEPPQAAWAVNVFEGHIYMPVWGGYASLGYGASYTNIDLGAYVTNQWMDVVACDTFEPGTGVTGGTNGLVQVWTRTCTAGVAAPTSANCTTPLAKQQISATNSGSAIPDSVVPTAWAQPDGTITNMYYKHGGYRNPQSITQTYYSGPFVISSTMAGAALAAFGQYP